MAASVASARDAYARRDWSAVYDGLHDNRDELGPLASFNACFVPRP